MKLISNHRCYHFQVVITIQIIRQTNSKIIVSRTHLIIRLTRALNAKDIILIKSSLSQQLHISYNKSFLLLFSFNGLIYHIQMISYNGNTSCLCAPWWAISIYECQPDHSPRDTTQILPSPIIGYGQAASQRERKTIFYNVPLLLWF